MSAVVLAFELHDQPPSGRGASETHCSEHSLGPGRGEADHLDAREQIPEEFGNLNLEAMRDSVYRAAAELSLNRIDDCRVGVAEEQRAVAQEIVDVFVAVDIPNVGARAMGDEDRVRVDEAAVVGAHAAGDDVACGGV